MNRRLRSALPIVVLSAVAVVVAAAVAPAAIAKVMGTSDPLDSAPSAAPPTSAQSAASPAPSTSSSSGAVSCPGGGEVVRTADQLQKALGSATPGTVIQLSPGVYQGQFVASAKGTAANPIFLCGTAASVLDGGDSDHGYVVHLNGADHWRLVGFSVRNGQKGVVADHVTGAVIQGLRLSGLGDEAIHLRDFSVRNTVIGNVITSTGLHSDKYGEGIYIGSAKSNWCRISDCQADRSDENQVLDNTISGTTSEDVDIKEGTSSGVLRGNHFDGSAMTDADSWVDVKGNDWLIEDNTGAHSPGDGFQTHQILDGWGTRNRFTRNHSDVSGPGYAIAVRPALENVVACDNTQEGAAQGLSNIRCTPG